MIYILRDKRTIVLAVFKSLLYLYVLKGIKIYILNGSDSIAVGVKIKKYILTMTLTVLMFLSALTGALEIEKRKRERNSV